MLGKQKFDFIASSIHTARNEMFTYEKLRDGYAWQLTCVNLFLCPGAAHKLARGGAHHDFPVVTRFF